MRSVARPGIGTSLIAILLWIASPQLIQANQTLSPADAPSGLQDKRCTLSGHVTNIITGEPLRKVSLKLLHAGTGALWTGAEDPPLNLTDSEAGYSATSDRNGVFQFENVEPGRYNLSGSRFGFLPARYTGVSTAKAVAVITLDPGQRVTDLSVPLTPQAVVSGQVIDEAGDPVVGSIVQVTAQKWSRGKLRYLPKASCAADDRGGFRCANLPPGKYYVSAQPRMDLQDLPGSLATTKPRPKPIRTYYPESPSLSNAALVDVTPGQDVPGVNIRMLSSQTFHIRGRVSGNQAAAYVMLANREDSGNVFMGAQPTQVKPDGSFDIPDVTPGAYVATIMSLTNREVSTTIQQNVDVSSADVNNVAIAVVDPVSLIGQLSIEGKPSNDAAFNFATVLVSLAPSADSPFQGPAHSSQVSTEGAFVLSKIPAGRYAVTASSVPGVYVKSIQFGQTELLGGELDLTSGLSGELRIVYRYGAAEVNGMPTQTGDTVAPSSLAEQKIMLVPDTLSKVRPDPKFARTDAEGKFKFEGLSPGHYVIYAFEQVDFEEIQNPELLKLIAGKGTPIELKEGDKKSINPPLISSGDLNQILIRSGIANNQ